MKAAGFRIYADAFSVAPQFPFGRGGLTIWESTVVIDAGSLDDPRMEVCHFFSDAVVLQGPLNEVMCASHHPAKHVELDTERVIVGAKLNKCL